MENLFEQTDFEIEKFIDDAISKDREFRENGYTDPDFEEEWFGNRKKPIYKSFKKEYDKYNKGEKYFFGCLFSVYEATFGDRQFKFLSSFDDYEILDFLENEIDEGLLVFNRDYMDPEMSKKIEVSLRRRFSFLQEKANSAGYEIRLTDKNNARLIRTDVENPQPDEDLDSTKLSPIEKVLYLHELGVIDFLKKTIPFVGSSFALSRAIAAITDEKPKTLDRNIAPLHSSNYNQDRNPLKSTKTHNQVKSQLSQIGYKKLE
jgi:hypothetical protein